MFPQQQKGDSIIPKHLYSISTPLLCFTVKLHPHRKWVTVAWWPENTGSELYLMTSSIHCWNNSRWWVVYFPVQRMVWNRENIQRAAALCDKIPHRGEETSDNHSLQPVCRGVSLYLKGNRLEQQKHTQGSSSRIAHWCHSTNSQNWTPGDGEMLSSDKSESVRV